MRRIHRFAGQLVVGTGLLAMLGVAAAVAAPETDLTSTEDGKALYTSYCASCHGLDGRSGTSLADLFEASPPDLTQIADRRGGWFPEFWIREIIDGRIIAHGKREMPVWGFQLSQTQIIAIVEHLLTLQAPPPPKPTD